MSFADLLLRLERSNVAEPAPVRNMRDVLKAYNEIHHQKAIHDLDVEAMAIYRDPRGADRE
jgi:hypothetical protein